MKPLRIAIIAQLDSPTITGQLAPALHERGHVVDVFDISTVPEEDFVAQPQIQALAEYDLVYYRSGLTPEENATKIIALEAFLSTLPIKTVNLHYTKHPIASSKIYEAQQAEKYGLKVPTSIYSNPKNISEVSPHLALPFILKTDQGTHGTGVHLIKDAEAFIKVTQSYPNQQLLIQEFIPHDFEYRVHALAGEAIGIYKKSPPTGDFRSNVSQGGQMLIADQQYTPELTQLTNGLFSIFDFEIFVADFMLNKDTGEFYFTEINLNPGWEISDMEVTGVDVTKLTADYFERICS